MKVVLDLNVILDVLLARDIFQESAEVLSLARQRTIDAYFPLHGITTIYYICKRSLGDEGSREASLRSPIPDLEDAIVEATARTIGATCIITRDLKHFPKSEVRCLTPLSFIAEYA